MKAFRKWWGGRHPEGHIESMGFKADSESWRAALEMLLQNETIKPLLGGEHRYIDSIFIRNELEGL